MINLFRSVMSRGGSADASLSSKVLKASYWSFGLRGTERVLQFVRTVVLARLLSPKEFGLFGIALLVLSTLESLSVTGFQQALVQKKDDIRPYLDTAWTVSVVRGIILGLIVFLSGPLIGDIFHEPQSVLLFRIAGLCVLLKGFTNIGVVYFQKNLAFSRQFIFSLSGTIVDLAVSILSALAFRNAWALLFGFLAGSLVRVCVSFIVEPYRPKLRLDMRKAKEMSSFGRWIFLGGILTFLLNQGDSLTVGTLLGAASLGLYRMAYMISSLPTSEIVYAVGDVIFSAFSKLQDKVEALRRAYLDTVQIVALVTFPMTGGILLVAGEFAQGILGPKWQPMVPALQVLAVWGLSRSISATTGALFQSVGRPEIGARLQFARLLVFGVLVYPLTLKGGILGTSLAVAISGVALEPLAIYLSLKLIECRSTQFMRLIVSPALATATMCLTLSVMRALLGGMQSHLLRLGLLVLLGALSYAAALIIFDRIFGSQIRFLMLRRYTRLGEQPLSESRFAPG